MSINDYCTKIKTMADLLANMDKEIPDANLVAHTINGLPRKWEGVAMHIRLQKPPPSWIETRAILLGEEHRLNSSRQNGSSFVDNSSSSTVLYSGQGSGSRRNNKKNDTRQFVPQSPPIRYGWVYIPPPSNHSAVTPTMPFSGQMQFRPNHRPNRSRPGPNQQGLLPTPSHNRSNLPTRPGAFFASQSVEQPTAQHVSSFHSGSPQVTPPYEWFNNDQATSLPEFF